MALAGFFYLVEARCGNVMRDGIPGVVTVVAAAAAAAVVMMIWEGS
jgi:hypothetical protein